MLKMSFSSRKPAKIYMTDPSQRREYLWRKYPAPKKDQAEDKYRIGLYIRDSAAGIGTMTFFEPKSKKYGALGHVISDMDTKKPIVVDFICLSFDQADVHFVQADGLHDFFRVSNDGLEFEPKSLAQPNRPPTS